MAPKRKAPDDEAQPPAAKKQLAAGGARAGAGRKRKQENQPGVDAAGGPKRTQPTLADLLGQRTPKQPKPAEAAAVEVVTWVYERHDGEDKSTPVAQQQRRGGRVQWFGAGEGATVTLLKKGPETYYANRDLIADVEVESTHEKATVRERHGGKLQLQVTTGDGTLQAPVWVTWGHVLVADEAGPAGGAGGATPDPADGGGADDGGGAEGGGGADGGVAEADGVDAGAGGGDADAADGAGAAGAADGDQANSGGVKAAAKAKAKPRAKGPPGATGHMWNPQWLDEYNWLRTEPDKTLAEWTETPKQGPAFVFCLCCHTFPGIGHKDVVQKKKPEAMRSDKLRAHSGQSHLRALAMYESKYGPIAQVGSIAERGSPNPLSPATATQPSTLMTDAPLASLIRTAVSTVLAKCAVQLVPTFVELQRANGASILSNTSRTNGVLPFLHAAAVILIGEQNQRLRAAGMLSKMGDGSSDRKTTEQVRATQTTHHHITMPTLLTRHLMFPQEVIYVRYPAAPQPITVSLGGIRWTTEYLDIRKVDVTYSKDKKSFDANAVLRSTYHAAFLERGLASLPEQTAAVEVCLLLQHVQMQCRCSADAVQMQCRCSADAVH